MHHGLPNKVYLLLSPTKNVIWHVTAIGSTTQRHILKVDAVPFKNWHNFWNSHQIDASPVFSGQSQNSISGTFCLEHQLVGTYDPDAGWSEPVTSTGTSCHYFLSLFCSCNVVINHIKARHEVCINSTKGNVWSSGKMSTLGIRDFSGSIEFLTIRKSDRSVRNKMRFLQLISN